MNALEVLFDWMLAATIKATALTFIILGIQFALRRWLPAGWRHALWLPLLGVLLLPDWPGSPIGLFPAKKFTPMAFPVDQTAPVEPSIQKLIEPHPPEHAGSRTGGNVLALIWLAGACGVMSFGFAGYRKSMKRVRLAEITCDPSLRESIENAAREAGLARAPRVMVSTAIESPAVTGLLRPALLLPAEFPDGLSAREARLVLLHECAHLKRFDLPQNWLSCVLLAVHWFNPILWFAFARMRTDREAACDARVLSMQSADLRAEYGCALLKLHGMASSQTASLGFVGAFPHASELKFRIHLISRYRRPTLTSRTAGGLLCTLLLILGGTKAEVASGPRSPDHRTTSSTSVPLTEPQEKPANRGAARLSNKLRTIVVPQADFNQVSLAKAVEFIRIRSKELDLKELDPGKKGINLVIRQPLAGADGNPTKPYGAITLSLKNVTLEKLIKECAEQSGTRYQVDEFAVTFVPLEGIEDHPIKGPSAPTGFTVGSTRVTGPVADVANKIIIPSADFSDSTLQEAVNYLNGQAKLISKAAPAVKLVIDPKVDSTVRIKDLRLTNVPYAIAATYCAEKTRLRLVAGDKEIRFMRWGDKDR